MKSIFTIVLVLLANQAFAASYVVSEKTDIVVQQSAESDWDWAKAEARPDWDHHTELAKLRDAVGFLQEGVERMTGRKPAVRQDADLSRGLVIMTLAGAPQDVRDDKAVQAALGNNGKDAYNHVEAFFIRSEVQRVLIVVNTAEGACAAVVELLESAGYEILGMGPNWIHVPKLKDGVLVFDVERAGRPSYYVRSLTPTSGQERGVGTIHPSDKLPVKAPDELTNRSYWRWAIGARMAGRSMPQFPGHALQQYHRPLVEHIRKTGETAGFLTVKTVLGADADRPAAAADNKEWLWINKEVETGPKSKAGVFLSDGTKWNEPSIAELGANLDLSVPAVRAIIFEDMKKKAEAFFAQPQTDPFVFGMDPEDGGGYANLAALLKNPNWYPEYLAAEGVKFGAPYVLHQYNGLDQPKEIWDANAPADTVFGFANWLLREFDKWIDTLPAEKQVDAKGRPRKDQVRCSFYSYNYHDVPPNFNMDPRVRVMIASYPKHRAMGKWRKFVTQLDMARAFQVMLPREPSGDYRIISLAYYMDFGVDHIPMRWSAAPASIAEDIGSTYRAGIKALNCETDFNFGKFGLAYYLYAKMMWNAELSADELNAIRDRWLQRAFGSAAPAMKTYYDFMLLENYPVNGPNTWARAIRLLDEADKLVDPNSDADAQQRVDDVKLFWYCYYLQDAGLMKPDAEEAKVFLWKGQSSYANAMHVISRRVFKTSWVAEVLPAELAAQPARYTHEETQQWWAKVLEHWKYTPVANFADAVLANGMKGSQVDLNDLVRISSFEKLTQGQPLLYNSGYQKPGTFLTTAEQAGQEIGFTLNWPAGDGTDRYYAEKDVPWGVDWWNARTKQWEQLVDKNVSKQSSRKMEDSWRKAIHVLEIRYKATQPGTYRFDMGFGGNASYLAGLGFDLATGKHTRRTGFTYFQMQEGHTQDPLYLYIPKNTKSLDLETWDGYGLRKVVLFKGMPPQAPTPSREVDASTRGTHVISLEPGEDGTIALLKGNGFASPFIYSVPPYWAKSPSELLVPRAIAEADGLPMVK